MAAYTIEDFEKMTIEEIIQELGHAREGLEKLEELKQMTLEDISLMENYINQYSQKTIDNVQR